MLQFESSMLIEVVILFSLQVVNFVLQLLILHSELGSQRLLVLVLLHAYSLEFTLQFEIFLTEDGSRVLNCILNELLELFDFQMAVGLWSSDIALEAMSQLSDRLLVALLLSLPL